jgi:cob(I)alamin adenosyltransferase
MKLYTKTGDDGTTGLFGPDRVGKDHPRVEAYGCVDELNAHLGLAAAMLDPAGDFAKRLAAILAALQERLFDLGADLATPLGSPHESKVQRIRADDTAEAERWIDEADAGNDPMITFVLPGGSDLAARLHVARTVCRRAERRVVNLSRAEPVNKEVLKFLNRVGDLLFALARRANKDAGIADVPWQPDTR